MLPSIVSVATRLPKALRKTPLLEAVFELRFRPAVPSAGDLLPGLLFRDFRADYPKVEQLPVATIPREMREKDADLLHQPTHRLVGTSSAMQIGERVVSLTMLYPYPGWTRFKEQVLRLLHSVGRTELIRECERFAFRYINIIPAAAGGPQLPRLTVRLDWPGHGMTERGLRLRFERDVGDFVTIVQITPEVTGKVGETSVSGLLVDVDTLRTKVSTAFWDAEPELLENAHQVAKQTFYSLLTDATLESLEPIYDDTH
jgi:uncharacterized protein (TIGR04255 family)